MKINLGGQLLVPGTLNIPPKFSLSKLKEPLIYHQTTLEVPPIFPRSTLEETSKFSPNTFKVPLMYPQSTLELPPLYPRGTLKVL